MPEKWEDRASMFLAYLIDKVTQSATIKSYLSAIKSVLADDEYPWSDNLIKLSTLTRACKLENDILTCRLPIQVKLLELILFEIQRMYETQPYLEILFKAIFALAYYGLMRIGELTLSQHVIKAKDVHSAMNKNKILLILYSSKTHSVANYPQKIKITAMNDNMEFNRHRFFCPFRLVRNYVDSRGPYSTDQEQFFVFKGKIPVKALQVRKVMRMALSRLNLNPMLYNTHSYRIGRSVDLYRTGRFSIDCIRQAGRWRSNAVYRYLR